MIDRPSSLIAPPLLCALLLAFAPAADDTSDAPPAWRQWRQLAELVAEGQVEEAREHARLAGERFADQPVHHEAARAWVAWLDAALGLPPEGRAEFVRLQQLERRAGSLPVVEEMAAYEELLAGWDELLSVPAPQRERVLLDLAMTCHGSGRMDEAGSAVSRARAAAEARWPGDHPVLASILVEEARQCHSTARLDEAWEKVTAARDMLDRLDWREGRAVVFVLNQLAVLAGARGDDSLAIEVFPQLVAATASPDSEEYGSHPTLLLNYATALREEGRLEQSLAVLRRVEEVQRESGIIYPSLSYRATVEASVLRRQGHLARAEEILRGALAASEADTVGDAPSARLNLLSELGGVLSSQGRDSEAVPLLEQARALCLTVRGPRHDATFVSRLRLAQALRGAEQYERGLSELLDLLSAQPGDQVTVFALADLGQLLIEMEREPEALEVLAQARELCERTGISRPLRFIETAWGFGLGRLGRHAEALPHLRTAAQLMERDRLTVGPGFERSLFGRTSYHLLASLLLEEGQELEAWKAHEARNGRALLELITRRDQGPAVGNEKLGMRSSSAADVAAMLRPGEALLGWQESRGRRLWCWVLRPDGELTWIQGPALSSAPGQRLEELAQRYREAMVDAAWSAFGAPDPGEVRELGARLWELLLQPAQPALEGVEQLLIVRPDALDGVPFEAFVDGDGAWACQRYALAYTPSASVLAQIRSRASGPGRVGGGGGSTGGAAPRRPLALIVADPPFRPEHVAAAARDTTPAPAPGSADQPSAERLALRGSPLRSASFVPASLPRLSASRAEARDLAERCREPLLLLGEDASEARLEQLIGDGELPRFELLHFATHARADARDLTRSELILSQVGLPATLESALEGRDSSDGRLTAGEVLDRWRLDAWLVTLSACETAGGQPVEGEGAVGLAQVFLVAGARNLLVSAWQVDDEATRLFMGRFYQRLLDEGRSLAEALTDARAFVAGYEDETGAQPYAHPCHWAGFLLMGAGE